MTKEELRKALYDVLTEGKINREALVHDTVEDAEDGQENVLYIEGRIDLDALADAVVRRIT